MMAWDGGVGQAALLGSTTGRSNLVAAIVKAVGDRAADGVNLDFEPVSTSLRDQYTSFVRQLKAGLVAGKVGSYLTVDTMAGAATWSTGYDVGGLTASGAADALFAMGYDYSWSGSARAGGVAPMDSPYMLDVNESAGDYLRLAAGSRIIWGVPYYGRTWQTTSGDLNALTRSGASGASKAYYYTAARDKATQVGRLWDSFGKGPWFKYWDVAAGTWVEGYYDDATSLAYKYDMVNQRGLAGTGMWTLLMDEGDSALWNLIANKFVNDTTPPNGGIRLLPPSTDALATPVSWAATDVGSGVRSYSVQVLDRSGATWTPWLTNTTATSAYYVGVAGHSYEFRMSAVDFKGNVQPWLAAHANPGSTLTVGGFARVAVDTLNVRAGAGTGFTVLETLSGGSLVALLGGPIDASGYRWYQVQFGFTEWPSAAGPLSTSVGRSCQWHHALHDPCSRPIGHDLLPHHLRLPGRSAVLQPERRRIKRHGDGLVQLAPSGERCGPRCPLGGRPGDRFGQSRGARQRAPCRELGRADVVRRAGGRWFLPAARDGHRRDRLASVAGGRRRPVSSQRLGGERGPHRSGRHPLHAERTDRPAQPSRRRNLQ